MYKPKNGCKARLVKTKLGDKKALRLSLTQSLRFGGMFGLKRATVDPEGLVHVFIQTCKKLGSDVNECIMHYLLN